MSNFKDLGVKSEFIEGLTELGILEPSEIQEQAIPYLIKVKADFIGLAQTGTGKTAAFGLPLLQQIDTKEKVIQGLILAPTRELVQQIKKQLFKFTKYSDKVFLEAVYGGEKIDLQKDRLRRPTHIIVATPGRLVDLINQKVINLNHVKTVVLDEADEMLSMGFKEQLDAILKTTPEQKKTWLFSATMGKEVQQIVKNYMSSNPKQVIVESYGLTNENISHQYVQCTSAQKVMSMIQFIKGQEGNRGIIFCNTKSHADTLSKQLIAKNISADALQGDLTQKERDKVMRAFKNESIQVLVSTDVSARGIDVKDLAFVLHHQLPVQTEYYTHRSGRTARAGKKGISLAFIAEKEMTSMQNIERKLGIKFSKTSV